MRTTLGALADLLEEAGPTGFFTIEEEESIIPSPVYCHRGKIF
jgi:hypothetical protein